MLLFLTLCRAAVTAPLELTASWYSLDSLKKEGTFSRTKGIMANGKKFDENKKTCATRLFPLGTRLKITSLKTKKSVIVTVTDRIGKKYAQTRIDLSPAAFGQLTFLEDGLCDVIVEVWQKPEGGTP